MYRLIFVFAFLFVANHGLARLLLFCIQRAFDGFKSPIGLFEVAHAFTKLDGEPARFNKVFAVYMRVNDGAHGLRPDLNGHGRRGLWRRLGQHRDGGRWLPVKRVATFGKVGRHGIVMPSAMVQHVCDTVSA